MQIDEIPLHNEKITVWCDKDLLLWGKQPGWYHGFRTLMHYASNTFSCRNVKDEEKKWAMCSFNRMVQQLIQQSITFLRGMLSGRLLSRFENIPWAPCSWTWQFQTFSCCGISSLKCMLPGTCKVWILNCNHVRYSIKPSVHLLTLAYG
jgi:hypothetical protein